MMCKILLSFVSLSLLQGASSYKLRLEGSEDQGSQQGWQSISCKHIPDYEAYIDEKCSSPLSPLSESYFQGTEDGVWSICGQTVCEFVYYDEELPYAKDITIKALISGQSSIKVEGKSQIPEPTPVLLGEILPDTPNHPEYEVWQASKSIHADEDTNVIIITVSVPATATDFALIDYIELDYGEGVAEPPTEPTEEEPEEPTTVPNPPKEETSTLEPDVPVETSTPGGAEVSIAASAGLTSALVLFITAYLIK